MKIRQGFVSNSSSSSFIVIGDAGLIDQEDLRIDGSWTDMRENGEYEFGWQQKKYSDVYSRVNFAFLQALSVKNDEWINMIKDAIREHTGANIVEHGFLFDEHGYLANGYIDHQSCATCGANIGMFESQDHLMRFLFDSDSIIVNDNDNH